MDFIVIYKKVYDATIYFDDLPNSVDNSYRNLLNIMKLGFTSTDWIPPLMMYYLKYKETSLIEFIILLDNKFSADWILSETPTNRIVNMNNILKKIESAPSNDPTEILADPKIWYFDSDKFINIITDNIYGKKFAKYLLLKLEYLAINQQTLFNNFNVISIEHVLPQNPHPESEWLKKFSSNERESLTNKLGNLVLISRKKNSQLGNKDFDKKKESYFYKFIDTFPNSLKIIQENEWVPNSVNKRQNEIISIIKQHYKIK